MSESSEELKRIAVALEEILRLVKKDLDAAAAYRKQDEQKAWARPGPHPNQSLAMAPEPGAKLQAPSRKLQASSLKLDKTGIQDYKGV